MTDEVNVTAQPEPSEPQIALALGSGSARGWAHIGVIKALEEAGITPSIVCGSSIGAIIGGAYVHGRLDDLETWARSLGRWKVMKILDLTFSRGTVIDSSKLRNEMSKVIDDVDLQIEDLPRPFAATATDLYTGREIRFTHGSLHDAIWSSAAIPGILPPMYVRGRWLIDGGVVNPVPVDICRHLDGDIVIAVNLNGDIIASSANKNKDATEGEQAKRIQKKSPPNMFDTFADAINIMQDRITRSRMVGDPPDVFITPRLANIGMMEFERADEAIAVGYASVERQIPEIKHLLSTIQRY